MTSHAVVNAIRRISGERRVGHLGTLDPAAAGVLPLALGSSTRLIKYLPEERKGYRAEIRLGITTDTKDGTGKVTGRRDVPEFGLSVIQEVLQEFSGDILQVPPAHSALRVGGRRAYELARRGVVPLLSPRPVTIHKLVLVRRALPLLTIDVECSRGTYIRSLAADLGEALGCGAHLSFLVRTSSGSFHLEQSLTLQEVETAGTEGLLPLLGEETGVLGHMPAVWVNPAQSSRLADGRALGPNDYQAWRGIPSEGTCSLVTAHATSRPVLAVVLGDQGGWLRPTVVLCRSEECRTALPSVGPVKEERVWTR